MKKSMTLIFSIVILLLLVLALVVDVPSSAKKEQTPNDSQDTANTIDVLTLSLDVLHSVTVTEDTHSVTYLPPDTKEGHWSIQDFKNFPLKEAAIDYRLEQTITISASQQLASSDLSEYGLDHPSKTITYTFKEPNTPDKQLLLGDLTLDHIGIYAMVADEPHKLYVLPSSYNTCMTTDLSVFIEDSLSDFNPDTYSIQKMYFSGKDFAPITIALSPHQNGIVGCFDFTCEDYTNLPVSNGTLEKIKSYFPDFSKIQSFVASNVTDLKSYGLDTPRFHLVIDYAVNHTASDAEEDTSKKVATETLDLSFGATLENGEVAFIIGNDTQNVYSMEASFIDEIMPLLTPFSLCDKYLALPNIADVQTITLDFNELNTTYHLNVDFEKKTYTCNDVPITDTNFRPLYRDIIGLQGDKALPPSTSSVPSAPHVLTIRYTLKDGTSLEVFLTESEYPQYYQTLLHQRLFVGCSKKQVTHLKDVLDQAIKGENLAS